MKINNKKGFTLIELLVVIAIIGILATGGIGVYTSQMAKARDASRTTDLNTLISAVEQFNQEVGGSYPVWNEFIWSDPNKTYVKNFLQKMPVDSKIGQECSPNWNDKAFCDFAYIVNRWENWVEKSAYELSIAFEAKNNVKDKASNLKDWGGDNARYEHFVWNISNNLRTGFGSAVNKNQAAVTNEATHNWTKIILIRWDKVVTANPSI